MLKGFSVPKIFKFLSWYFGHLGPRLNKKLKVYNFKMYDVIDRQTNICKTHIAQYYKK